MFRRLFSAYILEMIRFSHTLFALPFALLAAVMAWSSMLGKRRRALAVDAIWRGSLLCMVAARSAAMAFNRIGRRAASTPRIRGPQSRHLPAGLLSRGERGDCSPPLARRPSSPARCCSCRTGCRCFWRAGVGVFAGLQFCEAVHGAGAFLAGGGTDAGPGVGLDRDSRARRAGRAADLLPALCWAGRCCCGSRASTSSMPARMSISIASAGCQRAGPLGRAPALRLAARVPCWA